ncbi:MAG: bifunctional hydroxymethylpyrimidine kinase/phosphomethylpyrimidine kinase [Microcella sp.]|uniref:1-phosphofructokinase family hexose kinase n=1 Tax=Microcella sp. TaxID=1913979 RepID=UPI0024CDD705|nr:PfkB family carbohydrate kinase [Microcella sp.]UYN84416.1 MAG: bifunctional hydroxymethylpyrimidine kinase/phosphomethylpyrimidine kinase [Microcella sp.]
MSKSSQAGDREHRNGRPRGRAVIFAPAPLLTITIEDSPGDGQVHLHAGGQGVWQARMLASMGTTTTMCASFAGESGRVLQNLITHDEGFDLVAVERDGDGAVYIHDRRGGERQAVIETDGEPLSRHALDELYGLTIGEAMKSDVTLLSGPAGSKTLPADAYRRLAADLRSCHCHVVVDLAGDRLESALAGGVDVAKVSHEELMADDRITDDDEGQIIDALRTMHHEGADVVVATRADRGMLVLEQGQVHRVTAPIMEVVDSRGAGDSFTGALAATLARGASLHRAIRVGAAAGALNVTRHGLGTGDAAAILRLSELVSITPLDEDPPDNLHLSPDELAGLIDRS